MRSSFVHSLRLSPTVAAASAARSSLATSMCLPRTCCERETLEGKRNAQYEHGKAPLGSTGGAIVPCVCLICKLMALIVVASWSHASHMNSSWWWKVGWLILTWRRSEARMLYQVSHTGHWYVVCEGNRIRRRRRHGDGQM